MMDAEAPLSPMASLNIGRRSSPLSLDHRSDSVHWNPEQPAASPSPVHVPVPLKRPKAVRPKVHHHVHLPSGEHTPRVAAARRDLYGRVNNEPIARFGPCKPVWTGKEPHGGSDSIDCIDSGVPRSGQHQHKSDGTRTQDATGNAVSAETLTSAATTSESTPIYHLHSSDGAVPLVQFAARRMSLAAGDSPGSARHHDCFKHAQDSPFKVPDRVWQQKPRAQARTVQVIPSASKNVINPVTGAAGSGSRRRSADVKTTPGAALQWGKSYEKMIEDLRNLDIRDLTVVEIPPPVACSEGREKRNKQNSVPLNPISKASAVSAEDSLNRPFSERTNVQMRQEQEGGHGSPLPNGWKALKSRSTGRTYYGNIYSGKSTWKRPTEAADGGPNVPPSIPIASNAQHQEHQEASDKRSEFEARQGVPTQKNSFQSIHIVRPDASPRPLRQPLGTTNTNAPIEPGAEDSSLLPVALTVSDEDLREIEPESDQMNSNVLSSIIHTDKPKKIAMGRCALLCHLALTFSAFVATLILLNLQRKWIREGRFTDNERCLLGPPLMEWALGMAVGLVLLASLLLYGLVGRHGRTSLVRTLITFFVLLNCGAFILGNVWAFHTFPRSGAGCSKSWTLGHIEYVISVFIISGSYVGYGLAAILGLACSCRKSQEETAMVQKRTAASGRKHDQRYTDESTTNPESDHAPKNRSVRRQPSLSINLADDRGSLMCTSVPV